MASDRVGTRAQVRLDGEWHGGVVESVSYTYKHGQPVAAVALDTALPDGRKRVAVHVDNLEPERPDRAR